MPCNSDHMEATITEIVVSQIYCVRDELEKRKVERSWWNGYHPGVYGKVPDKKDVDQVAAWCCAVLSDYPDRKIKKQSLELQLWWRKHQEADIKRKKADQDASSEAALRASALAKLTPEERAALGFGDE